VALADTHAGHKLGLCNPQVRLPDEGPTGEQTWTTPALTAVQRWLWECYESDRQAVRELAHGDPITVIHNGDLTWGTKHPEGLVSTRHVDQYLIATANLLPWFLFPNVQAVRLIHGTESHEFGEGTAPLVVAEHLGGMGRDVRAARHGLYNVDGILIDAAHHGPSLGARHWLTGNTARYAARSIMLDCITRGRTPPDVILRAHHHGLVWETVREGGYTCEAIALPSYCGMTHYAAQVTRSAYLLACGLVALVIEDGRLVDVRPFAREVDLRTEETL
jgi:hypothetical protein